MPSKKYLNRRTGVFSGCAAILTIVVVVVIVLCLAIWLAFGRDDESQDNSAKSEPTTLSNHHSDSFSKAAAVPQQPNIPGSFFTMSTHEAQRLWQHVCESKYVKSNPAYETVVRNTRFIYCSWDDKVNANASAVDINGVRCPVVRLLCGQTRFYRIATLALESDAAGVTPDAFKRLISSLSENDTIRMSEQRAEALFSEIGLNAATNTDQWVTIQLSARMTEIGATICALAHEAGHLACGHVHGLELAGKNAEISRNMEREADSFSFSVICSSPGAARMLKGYLLDYGLLAIKERESGAVAGNHPLSQERIENLRRSNPQFDKLIRSNVRLVRELGMRIPEGAQREKSGMSQP